MSKIEKETIQKKKQAKKLAKRETKKRVKNTAEREDNMRGKKLR